VRTADGELTEPTSRLLTVDDDNNAGGPVIDGRRQQQSVPVSHHICRCQLPFDGHSADNRCCGKLPAIIVGLLGPVARGNAVIRRLAVAGAGPSFGNDARCVVIGCLTPTSMLQSGSNTARL